MNTKSAHSLIEALEARIAPAVFFLNGMASDPASFITDADGTNVNLPTVAQDVGATVAVLLETGDSLVLDANGDHLAVPQETVYAKVSSGSAVFYAKDLNGSTSFGANEITGIAFGDKFTATISGDVNGSVASLLTPTDTVSTDVLQDVSLGGLTVSGRIFGNLSAGKNLANVVIGASATGSDFGVQNILAGTAASGVVISFNGGGNFIAPTFAFAKTGEAGGNITNVTITKGAAQIIAGNGSDIQFGTGGAGGKVGQIKLLDVSSDFTIRGGNGGNSLNTNGKGGGGGGVSGVTIEAGDLVNGGIVQAGKGGNGNSSGGAGGAATGIAITTGAVTNGGILVASGSGGEAVAKGGAGGSLSNATLTTAGAVFLQTQLISGDGGFGEGAGGKAGAISKATLNVLQSFGSEITSGRGGDSKFGAGGAGGSIAGATINRTGTDVLTDFAHGLSIVSGRGGNSTEVAGTGKGGDGGSITKANIILPSTSGGHIAKLDAGDGGTGTGTKSGGRGGSISGSGAVLGNMENRLELSAGKGGAGANGGAGGSLKSISGSGSATQGFHFAAGSGGDGTAVGGKGGASGAVAGLKLNVTGGSFQSFVNAGVFPVVTGGHGGAGPTSAGGFGGSVSNITGAMGVLTVAAADGGSAEGKGGNGGTVSNILNPKGIVSIRTVHAGDGGDGAIAGKGGNVMNIKALNVRIGDQFTAFGYFLGGNNRMGGISVGQGGSTADGVDESKNGSVSGVFSTLNIGNCTISSIVAGLPAPNGLTKDNVVSKISKVVAMVGGDGNNDNTFSLGTDAGPTGFHLGDGDTFVDGVVLVKKGKISGSNLQGYFAETVMQVELP